MSGKKRGFAASKTLVVGREQLTVRQEGLLR